MTFTCQDKIDAWDRAILFIPDLGIIKLFTLRPRALYECAGWTDYEPSNPVLGYCWWEGWRGTVIAGRTAPATRIHTFLEVEDVEGCMVYLRGSRRTWAAGPVGAGRYRVAVWGRNLNSNFEEWRPQIIIDPPQGRIRLVHETGPNDTPILEFVAP